MSAVEPLSDRTRALLEKCGAATLANALLKRGFRNSFLLGLQAVAPGQGPLIGPAWTVRFIPAREDTDSMELYSRDDSLHRRAIEECDPGAVLVLATGGDARASSMGDLMALRLRTRGVAGAVTDGGFRDVPGIRATGLPCYQAKDSGPATPVWLHPVEFNTPVGLVGVAVYPGDIIVGNEEGIVAIPRHLVDEIAQECAGVADYESFAAAHIRSGRSLFGLFPATPDSRREYDDWVAAGRPAI